MLTGDINIKGCPKCGEPGVGRLQMGSPAPEWYKGPEKEKNGIFSRLLGKQAGKQ
jgi:hypothetical protein